MLGVKLGARVQMSVVLPPIMLTISNMVSMHGQILI